MPKWYCSNWWITRTSTSGSKLSMPRYRAILSYDGTPYQGYQRQRDGVPTVQGVVEAALARINRGVPVTVWAAGRTDTGVHATGQVIAFDLNWTHTEVALMRALNANLPDSVAVTALSPTQAAFHPRFDALKRAYRYTVVCAPHPIPMLRHRAWVWQHGPLNVDAMQAAAAHLLGKHDFASLGMPPQGTNTVRTVAESWWEAGDSLPAYLADGFVRLTWLHYHIAADAFLYRMVRRTVGLLVDVGRGKRHPDSIPDVLARAQIVSDVKIAPPQGLVLTRVWYPESPTS